MALPLPAPATPPNSNGSGKTSTVLTPTDTALKVTPPPKPLADATSALKDPALTSAWRRFLDYDRVSSTQKWSYTRIRELVIMLYFITATGAVLTAMLNTSGELNTTLISIMRIVLVIMPLVSVGLSNYANQFASSTAWIEYRVGAETIREKIYLYRQRAGEFASLTSLQDRQRKLLDIVNEADRRIDKSNATLPYMQSLEQELRPGFSIPERVRLKTDSPYTVPEERYDDGFSCLPVEDYLDFRIRNQVDWYTRRIDNDYESIKKSRLTALVIAGAGSVIAALGSGLEGLVVITTAAGVALNMKADSRMYGATYATYHLTASRLRNELNQWDILTADQKADPEVGATMVARMEKVLSDERETWRSSAIELQNTTDRAVNAHIRTDGNPIAVEAGKANTIAEFPVLQSSVLSDAAMLPDSASGELLHADTPEPVTERPSA